MRHQTAAETADSEQKDDDKYPERQTNNQKTDEIK